MVSVATDPSFPYLDMKLYWRETTGDLQFRVHLKPNQQLKYLNRDSTHTSACFKAIPSGVYTRLAKLTSILPENGNKSLADLYPQHFQKLSHAELVNKPTPTLREELEKYWAKSMITGGG
jgi:hypothetical protein